MIDAAKARENRGDKGLRPGPQRAIVTYGTRNCDVAYIVSNGRPVLNNLVEKVKTMKGMIIWSIAIE